MKAADVDLLLRAREYASSGVAAALRRAAGLSQHEVAAASRVSAATICRWEKGNRRPHGQGAIRWARLLDALARRDANAPP